MKKLKEIFQHTCPRHSEATAGTKPWASKFWVSAVSEIKLS